jgi:hypothetical protein
MEAQETGTKQNKTKQNKSASGHWRWNVAMVRLWNL